MHDTHSGDAGGIEDELDAIRQRRAATRRKPYRRSRLARHRADLVRLRRKGASYPELAAWLRKYRRVKVSHTTVMRFLQQLPELQEDAGDA